MTAAQAPAFPQTWNQMRRVNFRLGHRTDLCHNQTLQVLLILGLGGAEPAELGDGQNLVFDQWLAVLSQWTVHGIFPGKTPADDGLNRMMGTTLLRS